STIHASITFFFFFQAEDGIRDPLVTGVQTCALPICTRLSRESAPHQRTQELERRLVGAARIRAKVGCDGGIEIPGGSALAQALGLLAVGAHPAAPGLERARGVGTQNVGHGPSVPVLSALAA